MHNRKQWILTRFRIGWMFLAVGILVTIVGIFAEVQYLSPSNNVRIITGLGILFIGIGVGYLVRYGPALRDEQSARRLAAEERDERTVMIRNQAGNRAYWLSTALVYCGLMWTSFAASGGLPELSGDKLWYFLAACVVLPFGAYIASNLVDQRHS